MAKLSDFIDFKKLDLDAIDKRLIENCNWTASAKGPNGQTIREDIPKGTDNKKAAQLLVIAASKVASKDTGNTGLSVRKPIESRDKNHTASRSAALAGMQVDEHLSIVDNFANAFGIDDEETLKECVVKVTQRIGMPKPTGPQPLPEAIAERRKQAALALQRNCLTEDFDDITEIINETDWTDEQSGNDALEAIREKAAEADKAFASA